ncbi:hypothetical protein ACFLU6_03455 [Acidobacteriota bacterium]
MIVGYNVEIEHAGRTYHIQTEDMGTDEAMIETLVYIGGRIIHSERTTYRDMLEHCKDADIMRIMEMQHKRVIQTIRSGRFEEGPKKPFGEEFFSSAKSFDQVVLDFLEQDAEDSLELVLKGDAPLKSGQNNIIRVLARTSISKEPVPNASILVTLVDKDEESKEVTQAATGEDGTADITVHIPEEMSAGGSVEVSAESEIGKDTIRQLIS